MDKKNKKRYCIDEKINRQIRRARLRTKTGIILFPICHLGCRSLFSRVYHQLNFLYH